VNLAGVRTAVKVGDYWQLYEDGKVVLTTAEEGQVDKWIWRPASLLDDLAPAIRKRTASPEKRTTR